MKFMSLTAAHRLLPHLCRSRLRIVTLPGALSLAVLMTAPAQAEGIYFCLVGGVKTFSDHPCGKVEAVLPEAVQPNVVENLTPVPASATAESPSVSVSRTSSSYRTAPSAQGYSDLELRHLAEFNRVEVGMTPDLVERAWGEPDKISGSRWYWYRMDQRIRRQVLFSHNRVSWRKTY
ncbi:hypothetical protein ACKC9G_03985 [Pokkaliibacter sp. CJK22405]|uniref:hypothetical protein n=1 Tax=Pokkaliibacter sp. CJK22405 TaxID=3384615 RepID=UPI003985520C